MKNDAIKIYLESIKMNDSFDNEFVELLINSHTKNEDGEKTAQKIITVVNKRYAENQKDQT